MKLKNIWIKKRASSFCLIIPTKTIQIGILSMKKKYTLQIDKITYPDMKIRERCGGYAIPLSMKIIRIGILSPNKKYDVEFIEQETNENENEKEH